MNITPFFLAQRILFTHAYQKSISTMTIICFMGIFIGSFSLALITAIMNGFEVAIHEKMQGIHSHIIIQAYQNDIELDTIGSVLKKEFPEIAGFSPLATQYVLLRTNSSHEIPMVAMIKGIDPIAEEQTSSIAKKIIKTLPTTTTFSQLFTDNQIIIGKQLAYNNNISVADNIELLFIRENQIHGKKVILDSQKAIVSGIFDTGIDEFDSSIIYCSLSFLEKLYPNTMIERINIALFSHINEEVVIEKLRHRLGLEVHSWKDLYPALIASLKLEKYVSFFILALILLVASMNIMSLLFMHITQKKTIIALLKAMGMTEHSINFLFFIMGISISCIASLTGIMSALFFSYLLEKYPFITLPDIYYVTHLPVAMNWQIMIAVFIVVILLSICAMLIPLRRIRYINISQVLRFEG